jgi:hypothetical protein
VCVSHEITGKERGMRCHFTRGLISAILAAWAVAASPRDPLDGIARAAGDKEYLAIRHMARGNTCEDCHKENPPKTKTSHVACIGCHGDAKRMAERTKSSNPNPHAYAPDMVCTKCHYGHK